MDIPARFRDDDCVLGEKNVRKNLAQKTYDVFIFEDDRWLIDSHHDVRSLAVDRAEEIIADRRFAGVRLVAESERTGEVEILLEEMLEIGDKPLKIVAITEAPVCTDVSEYYLFPARQTAGRLLREMLDQRNLTALELAFDYGTLRMLERNDALFGAAMRQIGAIQARKSGETPAERTDTVYAAFSEIKETARVVGEDTTRLGILEKLGLVGLIDAAPIDDPSNRRIFVLGGLAQALMKRADWSDKLSLVMELTAGTPNDMVIEFLDEIAAEILDSDVAIKDFFGGFGDTVSAFISLIHFTQGRCEKNNPRSCLADFNALMASRPFPRTTSVLMSRVAKSLGGVRPLTRENKEAEREAFQQLMDELASDAGFMGGPQMAGALTARACIALADPEDLPVEAAIDHIMSSLPNRAVRLGFLLDLISSPLGLKNEQAVLNVMARLVQQLTSLTSLVPEDMPPDQMRQVMDALKAKLTGDALPEKWRALFADTLDRLVPRDDPQPSKEDGSAVTFSIEKPPSTLRDKVKVIEEVKHEPAPFPKTASVEKSKAKEPASSPKKEVAPSARKVMRLKAEAGDVLFDEGDAGDQAYLINSGEVEVFREVDGETVVLATISRGDILGEMSLIDNQPRMASARAVGEVALTLITREDLAARLDKLNESDKVLRRLIDVFVDRLRG